MKLKTRFLAAFAILRGEMEYVLEGYHVIPDVETLSICMNCGRKMKDGEYGVLMCKTRLKIVERDEFDHSDKHICINCIKLVEGKK
jgi:hypothetical protein